jgi:hypothetical protein
MEEKIRNFFKSLHKREVLSYLAVLVLATAVFVGMTFYHDAFQKIGYTLLFIELAILITVAWAFAGHAVMKSLFLIGASLSLIIFLAQSYCAAPNLTQSGNDALKTLLAFSFIYLGYDFFRSLYTEVTSHTKKMKEVNNGKNPWMYLVPFALFVGIFLWQLYQVISPIVGNFCVY